SWTMPNGRSSKRKIVIDNVQLSDSGKYKVQVFSKLGCVSTDSVFIKVKPVYDVKLSSNAPLCEGDTLILKVYSGALSLQWTGPNGFSSTQQNPVRINMSLKDSGIYKLETIQKNGCETSNTINVSVISAPVVTIDYDSIVCEGDTLELIANGA